MTRDDWTRREFIGTTAGLTAAALNVPLASAYASGSDILKVGLIGCGGRGTGAARDCMRSSDGVEIITMGDLFPDRLAQSREHLGQVIEEDPTLAPKFNVTDELCFTGFDAFRQVLAQDIDLVLIATPPTFRPIHVEAAVSAGKHIFMEKPVAVDPAGVRSIVASSEIASQNGLGIVAGTQRRHQLEYLDIMQRIHDGAIGEVLGAQVYWNQGGLWNKPREEGWTDVEWQLRNWLYFTWASGDHIVEQHIHNLDVANWALNAHPIKAVGLGGRQARTDPAYGHIFDHFAIDYEYPNGVHVMSMCRQIDGSANHVGEHIVGSNGTSDPGSWIAPKNGERYETERTDINPYVQEHTDLIASIRRGTPLNEGRRVAESTLTAIMGREAAYTGGEIVWDELLNAQQSLMPENLDFGPLDIPPVPMPGVTVVERNR